MENTTVGCGNVRLKQQVLGVGIRCVFADQHDPENVPCSLLRGLVLSSARPVHPNSWRDLIMEWTTPQHEEIDLNCEVSSYANAEL